MRATLFVALSLVMGFSIAWAEDNSAGDMDVCNSKEVKAELSKIFALPSQFKIKMAQKSFGNEVEPTQYYAKFGNNDFGKPTCTILYCHPQLGVTQKLSIVFQDAPKSQINTIIDYKTIYANFVSKLEHGNIKGIHQNNVDGIYMDDFSISIANDSGQKVVERGTIQNIDTYLNKLHTPSAQKTTTKPSEH